MSHDLNFRDGRASMMYVGEVPWHGLGTPLNEPATAQKAIQAAGLDWKVVKRPLFYIANESLVRIEDKMAVIRPGQRKGEPDKVFGVVSPGYEPLQNCDAFAFFDSIVGKGAAIYHTAGALGDGERVWVLAKLPDSIHVANQDDVGKYLLLSNSHDGRSAVQVKFTPIRVVCQNTLSMALAQGRSVRVEHDRNLEIGLERAKDMLGIINARYAVIEESFGVLAQVQMQPARLKEYVEAVFPDPAPPVSSGRDGLLGSARARWEYALKQARLSREESARLFEEGRGNRQPGIRGTLWAAYNAVAEMIDYRQDGMDADRHLRSMWFGQGYHVKVRAYQVAMEKSAAWQN
jgi:phage/plasmid-like protein (TIGR03299 family)